MTGALRTAALSLIPLVCFAAVIPVPAQNRPCAFDSSALSFSGTPLEQARCLLRPNGIGGVLGPELRSLPSPLGRLVGRKVDVVRRSLEAFLTKLAIATDEIGGPLDQPLSSAKDAQGRSVPALYFVIHDTSHPYLEDADFPTGFDTDPLWRGNDLAVWTNQPVAHVFVNRLGRSLTTTPFSEPVRKGFGTKFARDVLKSDNKGLKLHIELVQPRRRDPSDPNSRNDRIAPAPGFTDAQYDRLALLYVAASVRRGTWLVPGYHSAYDAGIKDAHDDPQNFELRKFAAALGRLLRSLR